MRNSTKHQHPSFVPLVKTIVGGHVPSIAETIVKHSSLAEMLFDLYVNRIAQQCGSLCYRTQELNAHSPFRKIPVDQVATFQWVSHTNICQPRHHTFSPFFLLSSPTATITTEKKLTQFTTPVFVWQLLVLLPHDV